MKKKKVLQQFRSIVDRIYNNVDEITDLLELEVEDEHLSILVERLRDDIQEKLDDDSELIVDLINNLEIE
jgi:hypothetical protein